MKVLLGFFLIIPSSILFVFSDISNASRYKNKSISLSPECIGQQFSKFKIKQANGSKFSNANLKNKIAFVTFWQMSSPNCVEQLDAFNEMYEKLKDSSNFIFVLLSPDSDSLISEIVAKKSIKYHFLHMDYNDCVRVNHGFGFPSSFVVNKNGKIGYYFPSRIITNKDAAKNVVSAEYNKILEFL
jgi:peroxiredoxin